MRFVDVVDIMDIVDELEIAMWVLTKIAASGPPTEPPAAHTRKLV
jgi:hypothetical protein